MDELTVQDARDLLMDEHAVAQDVDGEGARTPWDAEEDGAPCEGAGTSTSGLDGSAEAPGTTLVAPGEATDAKRSYAEGSVGLGVDIVEVSRMESILERSPAFAERVFSQAERDYCETRANAATHYALRFAAKEAVVKALGTGFSDGIGVRDIEVERASNGKPSIRLSGRALEIAEEQGVRSLSISLSYTHTDAVACAMAITEAAIQATEKRRDPMEELARQFKETRSILDEL